MNSNIIVETEAPSSLLGGFARSTTGILITQTNRAKPASPAVSSPQLDLQTLKARQKATWESGDFGQVAKFTMPSAEEFMARIDLPAGARVLDAAVSR